MSPTPSLRTIIDGVQRTLRRDASVTIALLAGCAVPGALLIAWLAGFLRPWAEPGVGPLALDVLVLAAAGLLVYLGIRRWVNTLDENVIASDADRTADVPDGTVRGVLELSRGVPAGTSSALARRAEAEVGRRFAGAAPAAVAARLTAIVVRRRRAAVAAFSTLTVATLLLAFAAPEHSRAAWSPLAHPVRSLMPVPLPAISVAPGDTTVQRGAALAVRVHAPGREIVTVRWRMEGDVPKNDVGVVNRDSSVVSIPMISAATEYWVETPDGVISRRYRITPTDALLLSSLQVDVVYPAYLNRPADHFDGEIPALEIPEGTQLVISGTATRPLVGAGLDGASATAAFDVDGDSFEGTFTPGGSGLFAWRLRGEAGIEMMIAPPPLRITVVPDAAPSVGITFPATDTVLDATLQQVVVADARDDHGLTAATLVSWRVARGGVRDADVEAAIDLTGDDRVLIRTVLDAATRNLVAGDTLKFYIRVIDNSPRRQTGVSPVIALRLPTMAELREESADRAAQLLEQVEQLARTSAELNQATRTLERRTSAANTRRQSEQQRAGSPDGTGPHRMDFEQAMPGRQALERQKQLTEDLEALQRNIDALESAMEQAGLRDGELLRRMEELRQLQEQLLTPELRQQMEALRNALDEMDPVALQRALERMAEQQAEMSEQLDRTLELMRRAAAEQEMSSLAQDARELAAQQQALAETMREQPPSAEQAETQEQLSRQAAELAEALAAMEQRLREQGEAGAADGAEAARQDAAQAGEQMQEAARDAARSDGAQAADKGEAAAEALERVAEGLDQAREAMADGWKQQARDSMDQATSDALSLAEQQQQLLERMQQLELKRSGGEEPDQSEEQQSGQQQGSQQGQQQSGQQQGGEQGQQQGGQQQGQQQGGQQGQQGGQQQGGQQGGQQQGGGQQGGQQGEAGQQGQGGGAGGSEADALRDEQSALQQGLQQLGRNLQDASEQGGMVNRETAAALARANLSMQQTLDAMQQGGGATEQAQQTLDALNRLALSLLNSSQQMQQSEAGSSAQQAMEQLADLASQQGSMNGQSSSLAPMDLTQSALSQQLDRLAAEQMEVARRLGNMNRGSREDMTGDIDALAREADAIARQLQSGQLPQETLVRQERLFHKLLDAGRTLEKDEYETERSAERPGQVDPNSVEALDARLFQDPTRFHAPTAAELQALPPAYRRLILDYFERLNRPMPPSATPPRGSR